MTRNDVVVGGSYRTKLQGRMATVRIAAIRPGGGWDAVNVANGMTVRIKNARVLSELEAAAVVFEASSDDATEVPNDLVLAEVQSGGAEAVGDDDALESLEPVADAVAEVITDSEPVNGVVEDAMVSSVAPQVSPPATALDKPARLSAIDAAARVLAASAEPMNAAQLIAAMTARGLWTSPAGKTPAATLSSAILREIKLKGEQARFVKVAPGRYLARSM